jgi:hypothetical protein
MPEPAGLPPPSIDDLATVTTDSPTGAMSPIRPRRTTPYKADSFAVPPFSTPKKRPSP